MTTGEIRDKLLEQRALYNKSVEASAQVLAQLQDTLNAIEDNTVQTLLGINIDIRDIVNFDLERMRSDSVYVQQCESKLKEAILDLHKYLEVSLLV